MNFVQTPGSTPSLIEVLTDIGIDLNDEDETIVAGLRFELEDLVSSNADFTSINQHIMEFESDWLNDIQDAVAKSNIQTAFANFRKGMKHKKHNHHKAANGTSVSDEDKKRDLEIANTILQQIGGMGTLKMMTGAYNFIALKNGVSFKIKNQRANYIKIVLTAMDLYDIEIGRIRGFKYTVVEKAEGLYFDQLKGFIERVTGMTLTVPRFRKDGGGIEYRKGGKVGFKERCETDSLRLATEYQKVLDSNFDDNAYENYQEIIRDTQIPKKELEKIEQYIATTPRGKRRMVDVYQYWGLETAADGKEMPRRMKDIAIEQMNEIRQGELGRMQLIRDMMREAELTMTDDEFLNLAYDYSVNENSSESLQWWVIDNLINDLRYSDRIDEFVSRAKALGWADQYARDGKAVGSKYAIAKGYWDQLYSRMNKKQREIYESEHKRLAKYFGDDESSFSDKEVADYIQGTINELLDSDYTLQAQSITIPFFKLGHKYIAYWNAYKQPEWWDDMDMAKDGRSVAEQNYEMVQNQNKQIKHHAKELDEALKKHRKAVPAWVLSKTTRASNDMSDVTHYLDGLKAADGNYISKAGESIIRLQEYIVAHGGFITIHGSNYGYYSHTQYNLRVVGNRGAIYNIVPYFPKSAPGNLQDSYFFSLIRAKKATNFAITPDKELIDIVEDGININIRRPNSFFYTNDAGEQYNVVYEWDRDFPIIISAYDKNDNEINLDLFSEDEMMKISQDAYTDHMSNMYDYYERQAEARQEEGFKDGGATAVIGSPDNDDPNKRPRAATANLKEIVFKKKTNPQVTITVRCYPNMQIVEIINERNIRFPYVVGQVLNMGHKNWACVNGYLVNDQDVCPEKKVMGIRVSDIPEGHPLRHIYPSKFRANGGGVGQKRQWVKNKYGVGQGEKMSGKKFLYVYDYEERKEVERGFATTNDAIKRAETLQSDYNKSFPISVDVDYMRKFPSKIIKKETFRGNTMEDIFKLFNKENNSLRYTDSYYQFSLPKHSEEYNKWYKGLSESERFNMYYGSGVVD